MEKQTLPVATTPPGLTIIGDVGIDLVMGPIDIWPQRGTEIIADKSEMRAGGSAANAALAARHLGSDCRLIAEVGNDTLGNWLTGQFQGLDVTLIPGSTNTSTTVGIIHADSERTFFTTQGHFETVEWSRLLPHVGHASNDKSIVLLTGVFLMPALCRDYMSIIKELHSLGYAVALDTGWPADSWGDATRNAALDWLSVCDQILLNDLEITHLAKTTDLDLAISTLADLLSPGATLVAKLGSRGAVAVRGGMLYASGTDSISVFDTIGAGDSFNAGYLLAQMADFDLADSLSVGCQTATNIINHFPRQLIVPGSLSHLLVKPVARIVT